MAFKRKILPGLQAIKDWCTSTFVTLTTFNNHTHTKYQVDGITPYCPAYPVRTQILNTTSRSTASNFSWTAPFTCWVRIDCAGAANAGDFVEHILNVNVTSTYDSSTANGVPIFRASFSAGFYRSDCCSVVPLRKGDTLKVSHSHTKQQQAVGGDNLGMRLIIERIYNSDWAHV